MIDDFGGVFAMVLPTPDTCLPACLPACLFVVFCRLETGIRAAAYSLYMDISIYTLLECTVPVAGQMEMEEE